MTEPVRRVASYDDLLAVPAGRVAELVHGSLVTRPRPSPRHARAATALGTDLAGPFDRGRGGPGGWWILFEPELHLGADVLVPDVAGFRRSRLPHLPESALFDVAPDSLCEILSPATARFDRVEKMGIDHREGVEHVWLLDPLAETLEVDRRDGAAWRRTGVHAGTACVRVEPFEDVEIDLAGVFER